VRRCNVTKFLELYKERYIVIKTSHELEIEAYEFMKNKKYKI